MPLTACFSFPPLIGFSVLSSCWVARHTCGRTWVLPRFFFYFPPLIPSELAERNSTKTGQMFGSECDLKTHVRNLGYTLPLQVGGQKHLLSTTSQLNGNFRGLYIQFETRYTQPGKCVDNYMGLLHRPKMSRTLVHKQLQTRPAFLHTLCKFCIPLHCHASQTEINKRNSTTLCQTVNSRPL